MTPSLQTIVQGVWSDFRGAWRQLILADLLARTLALAVLTPAVGLLLKLFLISTATQVVTDQAIIAFLFHPLGFLALLVVGSLLVATIFIDSGQLMIICFAAGENRRATWLDALLYAYRHATHIVALAGWAFTSLLRAALPFVAALGLIYWLLARNHDINYYLAIKPPEFIAAAVVAGLVLAGMALRLLHRFCGWLIGLPLVLFEKMQGRQALAASIQATATMRPRLTLWLCGWLLLNAGLSVGFSSLIATTANILVPRNSGNITMVLVVLSTLILLSVLLNFLVSVLTTLFFPMLVLNFYRGLSRNGRLDPEIAPVGSLSRPVHQGLAGKRVLAAIAISLVAGTGFAWVLLDDYQWEEQVQVIAHRGGAAVAPENTMAAFRQGIEDGADWLELDVQENADGQVIVQHDRDFMRAARLPVTVRNATDADLADLDIGSFFSPEFADQRVPTLKQVLELARNKAGVFIELKYYGHNVKLEENVHRIVQETGMADQIVIMSLDYAGVRRAAAIQPEGTYGLLNAVAVGDLTRLDVDFLALTAKACSPAMIRRTHSRGLKIHAWTVNDPVQMWVMMSRGVDGIITDRVALAQEIIQLRESMTPVGRFIVWLAAETGLLDSMAMPADRDDA